MPPIAADSQSKPDVAINEANRLIDQEKIDIINSVYGRDRCSAALACSRSDTKPQPARPILIFAIAECLPVVAARG